VSLSRARETAHPGNATDSCVRDAIFPDTHVALRGTSFGQQPLMDTLVQDLRFAVRSLIRRPGFSMTAIVTLALGIGATTAIFSVVHAVIMRPLPFPEPQRIVQITNLWTKTGLRGTTVSAPDFHDWKAQSRSFEAMGYFTGGQTSVSLNGGADYAGVFRITPGFFEALGARAAIGRLLSDAEMAPGGPLAVVITDAFWRRQFNGDTSAIGTPIKFGDRIFTIAGVLEPRVRYPARADIYVPTWIRPETTSRSAHNYQVIARLRKDVSREAAAAEMTAIARRLEAQYPQSNSSKLTEVVRLQEIVVGSTRGTLLTLLGAVALVLLIACANVANLLLARATSREREMVVRAAVGAVRGRLIRQLLTESAVLGLASALLGAWIARLGMLGLIALAPENLPRLDEIRVDLVALWFAIALALVASCLFGLAPALQSSRVQLVDGLRQGGKGSSIGARTGWARNAFVVAEIALAVVLVVGAGLLARSLAAIAAVDMGFSPERLLVLRTSVPVRTFDDAPRATAFYRDLLPELRALPGVNAAAGVTSLPTQVGSNGGYWIEGGPSFQQLGIARSPQAIFNVVTPEYFHTLGVPIRRGRDFTDGDTRDATKVAIINDALAKASFAGEDPIGRRIQCGLDTPDFMTIVGVVGDVRTSGPQRPAQPEIFMPFQQHPGPATSMNIVARTELADPLLLADTMRRTIADRNPEVPVRASTMDATLETASAAARFQTFLLVVFAGVALLLAVAGVYGVMAYTVSQRIPELGVRIALGATPEHIRRLILGQGAALAGAGLVLGMGLALVSGRVLRGFLFGVSATDPIVLASVVAAVALATLTACYIPVRRAIRVDPMVALRAE
jgi:putative ABC transport system permease protein